MCNTRDTRRETEWRMVTDGRDEKWRKRERERHTHTQQRPGERERERGEKRSLSRSRDERSSHAPPTIHASTRNHGLLPTNATSRCATLCTTAASCSTDTKAVTWRRRNAPSWTRRASFLTFRASLSIQFFLQSFFYNARRRKRYSTKMLNAFLYVISLRYLIKCLINY